MVEQHVIEQNRKEYISYGIALMLSSGIITVSIFFIGIISGMFIETLVYSSLYWMSKKYTGGYHCNSFYQCMCLSTGLYTLMVVCYKLAENYNSLVLLWLILSFLMLVLHTVRSLNLQEPLVVQIQQIDMRIKRKVAIFFLGGIVILALYPLHCYFLIVPLSYGIFISSILYQRKEC